MIETSDPYVWIEVAGDDYVRYQQRDPDTGEVARRWEQQGICPCNGSCMDGAAPGQEAWKPRDQRRDVPNTPEVECDPCTTVPLLRFVELEV